MGSSRKKIHDCELLPCDFIQTHAKHNLLFTKANIILNVL